MSCKIWPESLPLDLLMRLVVTYTKVAFFEWCGRKCDQNELKIDWENDIRKSEYTTNISIKFALKKK